MKKQLILFLFPLLVLVSCGRIVKLSEEDYSWMPYKGNETLIFKSNIGETDTMFFIRKDTLWGLPDPALSTSKYEIAAIFCKHSDPYMKKNGHRYLENYFLEIKKTMSKKAKLVINLSARNAKFYSLRPIRIDSLGKVKPVLIQTSYRHYNDIYIISPDDFYRDFHDRSSYVTKLYWSKSEGLIRYDKKDGVYWELERKY